MDKEKNIFRGKIESKQEWKGKKIDFDPDSSPKAWEHYEKFYTNAFWVAYNIKFPCFFVSVFDKSFKGIIYGHKEDVNGKSIWYNYVDCNKSTNNRLFAITNNTSIIKKIEGKDIRYYQVQLRLCGEIDFNFNDKHYPYFERILNETDNISLKNEGLILLDKCKKEHHTLLNFSLMQSLGDLQGFKGRCCDDRLDRFLYFLNRYYNFETLERRNTYIAINSSIENRENLIEFLNKFKNIYDYCEKVYFIKNKDFINKLIKSGEKPIDSGKRVVEYMELANEFWSKKEKFFIQQKCSVIGSYFKNEEKHIHIKN